MDTSNANDGHCGQIESCCHCLLRRPFTLDGETIAFLRLNKHVEKIGTFNLKMFAITRLMDKYSELPIECKIQWIDWLLIKKASNEPHTQNSLGLGLIRWRFLLLPELSFFFILTEHWESKKESELEEGDIITKDIICVYWSANKARNCCKCNTSYYNISLSLLPTFRYTSKHSLLAIPASLHTYTLYFGKQKEAKQREMIPSLMFFPSFTVVNKRQEGKFVQIGAVIVLRTDFRSQYFPSDIPFEWVKYIL